MKRSCCSGLVVGVFLLISPLASSADDGKMKVSHSQPGSEKMIHDVENKPSNSNPGSTKSLLGAGGPVQNPGTIKGFNPQPDPPGNEASSVKPAVPGSESMGLVVEENPAPEKGVISDPMSTVDPKKTQGTRGAMPAKKPTFTTPEEKGGAVGPCF